MERNSYFERPKKTKTEPIDDFGEVTFRKLAADEVEYLKKNFSAPDKGIAGYRYCVSKAVVDANGVRIFTDEDQAALAKIDYDILEAIALKIAEFSGLVKTDPKAQSVV